MSKQTSLYQKHVDLKAKMAPFGGFDMPIQYSSVKEETIVVRNEVGVFDVSHMGEFFVSGPDAVKFVDYIVCNDFAGAEIGKAVYSPMCREDGTVVDDLISYKLAEDKVMICANASNIEKDWKWINKFAGKFECSLEDKSNDYSLLAIQGPKAEAIATELKFISSSDMPYYSVSENEWEGEKIIVARTGYTGEDGFEVFGSHKAIANLWDKLEKAGVKPCGLAARDVLRLEVCFPLYGHEIHDDVTPLDSALKWTVKLNKENFVGKESLENYQSKFKLVKLSLEKGIPREGYEILNSSEKVIGKVTSGTMSVTLGRGIALAHVSEIPEDKNFLIAIRGKNYQAEYHKKAFVTGGHK